MRVGMIGLGNIGGHIANNLVTDGHEVTVYDVDTERVKAIEGAEAAASVAAVGNGGRDHDAVAAVARGRPPGGRRVGDDRAAPARSSSTSPRTTRRW